MLQTLRRTPTRNSIEATIRRVQAQASARDETSDQAVAHETQDDDSASAAAIESQIRRIQQTERLAYRPSDAGHERRLQFRRTRPDRRDHPPRTGASGRP